MALTLLGFVAPFIAILIRDHLGKGLGGGGFNVAVHNDGPAPLTLRCSDNCIRGTLGGVLTPGSLEQVVVSSAAGLTRYQVLDAAQMVVGCLPLTRAVEGVVVQTSQAEPCPGTALNPLPSPGGPP